MKVCLQVGLKVGRKVYLQHKEKYLKEKYVKEKDAKREIPKDGSLAGASLLLLFLRT